LANKSIKEIPFAASHVGSLPRPIRVQDMLPALPGLSAVKASRSIEMDESVKYAIDLQEAAGLDLISDGEWRRHAYTHIIADIASGFSQDTRPGRWGITVTDRLEVVRPGLIADEAKFLIESTDKFTKVCVPSPYLLGIRLWSSDMSSKAYPTRESFIEAVVPILHNEIVELEKTGVSVIQIDEPHLCVLVDPKIRELFRDPEYEMNLAVSKINEILYGIRNPVTAVHLCRRNWGRSGWGAEGGYEPILDSMKRINVDQYVMEFSIPAAGDVAIIKELPDDSLIGLGCVECRFEKIDTVEEIVSRVEVALEYVDPDRISLNPDCGFSPGLKSQVPLDEAFWKLKNEADAAAQLRDKYH